MVERTVMMIKYFNECCGCASPGYPCRGSSCSNLNVPHYFCDICDCEMDKDDLYNDGGTMMCADCILDQYEKWSD